MASRSITISGGPALQRALAQFTDKAVEKIERRAARKAAKPVQTRAKDYAPYDEGDLEASIKIRALRRSRKNKGLVGVRVMTSGADSLFQGKQFYGAFIEFGTAYIQPQPYLGRARDETRTLVQRIFHDELKRIVAQTAGETRSRSTKASQAAVRAAGGGP